MVAKSECELVFCFASIYPLTSKSREAIENPNPKSCKKTIKANHRRPRFRVHKNRAFCLTVGAPVVLFDCSLVFRTESGHQGIECPNWILNMPTIAQPFIHFSAYTPRFL